MPEHRTSILPDDTTPYDIMDMIEVAGLGLGFTGHLIHHLWHLVRRTEPQDWEVGSRPIVFDDKPTLALDMGISEETVRRREKRLHALGALTWNSPGHKRGGWRNPETGRLEEAYGVDLSPMITLYQTLLDAANERQLENHRNWKRYSSIQYATHAGWFKRKRASATDE